MSDHMDSPDPKNDICDLYIFAKPSDPTRTVLVLNVNLEAPKQVRTEPIEGEHESAGGIPIFGESARGVKMVGAYTP